MVLTELWNDVQNVAGHSYDALVNDNDQNVTFTRRDVTKSVIGALALEELIRELADPSETTGYDAATPHQVGDFIDKWDVEVDIEYGSNGQKQKKTVKPTTTPESTPTATPNDSSDLSYIDSFDKETTDKTHELLSGFIVTELDRQDAEGVYNPFDQDSFAYDSKSDEVRISGASIEGKPEQNYAFDQGDIKASSDEWSMVEENSENLYDLFEFDQFDNVYAKELEN